MERGRSLPAVVLLAVVLTALCQPGLAPSAVLAAEAPTASPQPPPEPPAPKPTEAVQKLLDEANRLATAKQLPESLQQAERALATARESKDLPGEAAAQREHAILLEQMGRTAEAVAAWRDAAAAWERAGDGPGQIEALAAAALPLGPDQKAEAEALAARALALGKAEAKRPLEAALMLHNAGLARYNRGQLNPAREFITAALAIQEKVAPNARGMARSLFNLGSVSYSQRDMAASHDYYQRALALYEKLAPNSLDVASCLWGLGAVAVQESDPAVVRDYFQRALDLFEKLAPDSLEVANCLIGVGSAARSQGNLVEAREDAQRALAIFEKLASNSHDVALALYLLGTVALRQKDMEAARDYDRRALGIFEKGAPNSLELAACLGDLTNVAREQGDLAGAREYAERALALYQKLTPNSIDVARNLTSLGLVAESQREMTGARDYYQRALAIVERLAPNSTDAACCLGNLGEVARKQGNLVGAREYKRRALALYDKLAPNSIDVAACLDGLAQDAEKGGDWRTAERDYRRAWELVRGQAGAVTGDEARQSFGASTAFYAANLIRAQVALGQPAPAFTTLEESRAQALLQLLLERRLSAGAAGTPLGADYRAAATTHDRAGQALSQASVADALARRSLLEARNAKATSGELAGRQAAVEAAVQRLAEAQSAYTRARLQADTALEKIKRSNPLLFATPLSAELARRSLPPDTLFLAFSIGEEQTQLFLLSPGGRLSVYPIAVKAKALQALVHALERALKDRYTDASEGTAASRALFAKLFPPQARELIRKAHRLMISPDGVLWEVPFAALVTNPSGAPHYLGAEKPITYTPSLTLFARTRQERPQIALGTPPRVLVVGDPIFDRGQLRLAKGGTSEPPTQAQPPPRFAAPTPLTRGELEFLYGSGPPPPRLPATRQEALAIAQCYGATPLLGEQATEEAVRQQMPEADIIHLATHGIAHPYRAMSSGLLLTVPETPPQPDDSAHDGFLQAWEISSQLPLKAELVVLSACETGRGENVANEGIVGLTRALQAAGARSIVASQWRVDDQSAARLMVAFHRKLRAGLAKDEALRQAMAEVRSDTRTSKPYFWAPFFLVGDPDNLTLGTPRVSAQARAAIARPVRHAR